MADPVTLTALSPHEAVVGALYRCVLDIDGNNLGLFESACLKNEIMIVVAGPISIEGWTAISEFVLRVFVVVTTHVTSNIRIQRDSRRK
jgi:hypothetical protein